MARLSQQAAVNSACAKNPRHRRALPPRLLLLLLALVAPDSRPSHVQIGAGFVLHGFSVFALDFQPLSSDSIAVFFTPLTSASFTPLQLQRAPKTPETSNSAADANQSV